jgi:hypothetical protein
MRLLRICALALIGLCVSAKATPYDDKLAALTHGLPKDIRDFIDRRANCNHWAGEDAYDTERRAQIEAATNQLGCGHLEKDEVALGRRYSKNGRALRALRVSKDLNPG